MKAPKKITSQAGLAKVVGTSEKTISLALRRDDWPVKRMPPWSDGDVDAVKVWRATELQEDRAEQGKAKQPTLPGMTLTAKQRKEEEQARKLKFENDLAEGMHISRRDHESVVGQLAQLVVAELEQMQNSLPLSLGGMDAPRMELELKRYIRGVRERLAKIKEVPA